VLCECCCASCHGKQLTETVEGRPPFFTHLLQTTPTR
jgi:hypothetical protein